MSSKKKTTTPPGAGLDTFFGQPKPAPKPNPQQEKIIVQDETPRSIYINTAEKECERYVPGRKRCDTRDPSGYACPFITQCAMRDKRFREKQQQQQK
jgi:hypothetical protein